MRTLVVEDNATFRKTFIEALRKNFPFMLVEEAVDGVEALRKVEAFMPELVFMDVRLPGETGLEVTKKIRALHPDMPIIILTDYDLPEYRQAALDNGANDFIVKGSLSPHMIETLVESISSHTTPSGRT